MAGLIAPRLMFVEGGSRDPIFPVEGTRVAIEKAQAIYRVFGVPDRFAWDIWDGRHGFSGKAAFEFLKQRL